MSCRYCLILGLEKPTDGGYWRGPFHVDGPGPWDTLERSAAAGCNCCALTMGVIRVGAPEWPMHVRSVGRALPKYLHQVDQVGNSDLKLEVHYGEGTGGVEDRDQGKQVLLPYTTAQSPWPTIPVDCFADPELPTLQTSIPRIKSWLSRCERKHACVTRGARSQLPTRVLHVGDGSSKLPRLCLTQGRVGKYVALSHCWGPPGHRRLTTTLENIRSHRKGIPLESFPTTFLDAIDVTRALGFKYIWIDSLCIIQDSHDDWVVESSRMADIYSSASLTLAADFGESSEAALFPRNFCRAPKVRQFAQTDAEGATHQIFVRRGWPDPGEGGNNNINTTTINTATAASKSRCCYASEATSRLDSRAWVLQERVLSPRTVFFTDAELLWECGATSSSPTHECACGYNISEHMPMPARAALAALRGATESGPLSSSSSSSSAGVVRPRDWFYLVAELTAREITFATDRLPALTGVAAVVPLPAGDYLAGMWRGMLIDGLLWRNPRGRASWMREYEAPPGAGSSSSADSEATTEEGWPAVDWRMPPGYAPSWSWASVSAPVEFVCMGKMLSVKSQGWSVVNAGCTPSTANPYGPVLSGFVEVDGYLFAVSMDEVNRGPARMPEGRLRSSRELRIVFKHRHIVWTSRHMWLDAGSGAREWADQDHDHFFFSAGVEDVSPWISFGLVLRKPKTATARCYSRIGMASVEHWTREELTPGAKRVRFRLV